jgi:glycosyltransferase involved in cell wall biosynthesis
MSKITILTQFFPPETNAGARRVFSMSQVLANKHDVIVIAPNPGYPTAGIYKNLNTIKFDKRLPLTVLRTDAFEPHHPSLVIRAIKEIAMAFRLFKRSIRIDSDVVIVSTPSMFLAPFAWILAKYKRAIFIYDLRDFTWKYVKETARYSRINQFISFMLETLMLFIIRKSDLVISATSGMTNVLVNEYRFPESQILTIPNGVSQETLNVLHHIPSVKQKQTVVTYVGLFGNNHGISILVDVAKLLPHVTFYLIGDGPEKGDIQNRLQHEDIPNLDIINYVTSLDKLASYYAQSTILVSHIKDTNVMNLTAVPAKLFEYMASEKPIIYAGKGIACDFLEQIGCAIIVPPNDPEAIANAIIYLKDKPELRKTMGKKGRLFVEQNYRREDLMETLSTEIEQRFHL